MELFTCFHDICITCDSPFDVPWMSLSLSLYFRGWCCCPPFLVLSRCIWGAGRKKFAPFALALLVPPHFEQSCNPQIAPTRRNLVTWCNSVVSNTFGGFWYYLNDCCNNCRNLCCITKQLWRLVVGQMLVCCLLCQGGVREQCAYIASESHVDGRGMSLQTCVSLDLSPSSKWNTNCQKMPEAKNIWTSTVLPEFFLYL